MKQDIIGNSCFFYVNQLNILYSRIFQKFIDQGLLVFQHWHNILPFGSFSEGPFFPSIHIFFLTGQYVRELPASLYATSLKHTYEWLNAALRTIRNGNAVNRLNNSSFSKGVWCTYLPCSILSIENLKIFVEPLCQALTGLHTYSI